jgi:uncharacterized protein with GYD domain
MEATMPFYMFQARYTSESFKAMIANPHDREAAVKPLIEAAGGTLHHLFFAFGSEDIVAIVEAPDDAAVAATSFVLGASGVLSAGATTKLMTSAEAVAAMQAAGKLAARYQSPTG